MTALIVVVWVAAVASVFCWAASLVTKDTSWVDRLWSILPVVYVWIFAGFAGFADVRLDVMAALVTLWGARLTFNVARKGGYTGVEDYRWAVLRGRMRPLAFQAFNLFFIVVFQNALLVLITLPAFTALQSPRSFGVLDLVATVLFLGFLAGETVADEQQWRFQQRKRAVLEAGQEPAERFLMHGLFSVSRHPNFFFEQAQWWTLAAFGVIAAGALTWTVAGAMLLTVLFVGSTIFTESITRSRYPEYADYQARVSPVVPWFPRTAR
jgi:steroid 5-alpha reductase family enzyme